MGKKGLAVRLDQQELYDLVQILIHPLVEDGVIRGIDGMGYEGKRVVGKAVGQGHGLAGIQEGFGADHRRWDAQLFHDDAVEHTARTAGASIPDTGDDGLHFGRQFFGHDLGNAVGGGRFFDVLKGNIRIPLLDPRHDFFQDIVGIPLAVIYEPDGQAFQADWPGGQGKSTRNGLVNGFKNGISHYYPP
jgi:hypothetical protein